MNKKVGIIVGIALVGMIGVAAFFGGKGNKENINSKEVLAIEHALGSTGVETKPEKVVVFDYAMLDAMDTLGIEGVVGTPQDSSIPEYLSKYKGDEYANIGGLKEPNLEKINELEPDLIIINGRQHSFYDKLSEIAPTISMAREDGKYMESFFNNMEIIGDIFNKEDEVKKELDSIKEKVEEINKAVTDKGYKASTIMVSDGSLSVFGADSRFGLIYNELGFKNTDKDIQAASHGQDVSFEYLASHDTDFMFVIDKSVISVDNNQKTAKDVLDNELINKTDAFKNGNIVYLDTHAWYLSDGGFVSTNKMLGEIKSAIEK